MVVALLHPLAARAADTALEEHDGFRGRWLRTDAAEVFVATAPKFRILAFRRPGTASLMADARVPEQGVRLAFMEPEQVPASFDVGNQPAEFVEHATGRARVRLAAGAGLRYTVDVSLDATAAALDLDYHLANVGDADRRVACWSLIAFARGEGTMLVPFGTKPKARRQLVLPWWTAWPQPGVRFGRDAMTVDCAAPLTGNAYKVGVRTDAAWVALVRGDRAIVSRVVFDPTAEYPEGGANITVFHSTGQRVWCETEQVGPLRTLKPGESTTLTERLDLPDLPDPPHDDPDKLRARIEASGPTGG